MVRVAPSRAKLEECTGGHECVAQSCDIKLLSAPAVHLDVRAAGRGAAQLHEALSASEPEGTEGPEAGS